MPVDALRIDVETFELGLGMWGREWGGVRQRADCNNF